MVTVRRTIRNAADMPRKAIWNPQFSICMHLDDEVKNANLVELFRRALGASKAFIADLQEMEQYRTLKHKPIADRRERVDDLYNYYVNTLQQCMMDTGTIGAGTRAMLGCDD